VGQHRITGTLHRFARRIVSRQLQGEIGFDAGADFDFAAGIHRPAAIGKLLVEQIPSGLLSLRRLLLAEIGQEKNVFALEDRSPSSSPTQWPSGCCSSSSHARVCMIARRSGAARRMCEAGAGGGASWRTGSGPSMDTTRTYRFAFIQIVQAGGFFLDARIRNRSRRESLCHRAANHKSAGNKSRWSDASIAPVSLTRFGRSRPIGAQSLRA